MRLKPDILVIEDNTVIQKVLAHHLKKEGYNVSFLATGKGAADIIKARNPDLVILDIMLPDVDGFSICQEVKGELHFKHIPILILSAVTKELTVSDESMQVKSGADAFMSKSKPFKPDELLLNVKKLIGTTKDE